jgi:hypothetical protein
MPDVSEERLTLPAYRFLLTGSDLDAVEVEETAYQAASLATTP